MSAANVLDRGLPASAEAERSILGAILLDNFTFNEAADGLSTEDFFLDSHARIFGRMAELAENGRPIDIISLAEELSQHKEVESIGGVAYLASLTDGVSRRPSIEQHIRIVKEKALLRGIVRAANDAIARAMDQDVAQDCLDGLEQALLAMRGATGAHTVPMAIAMGSALDRLVRECDGETHEIAHTTGIETLDIATDGGGRRGEIWLVGGRPNTGKTPLLLQMLGTSAARGVPVHLSGHEMSKEAVNYRVMAQVAASREDWAVVNQANIRGRRLSTAERLAAKQIAGEVMRWPWTIDDSSMPTIRQVVARSRLAIRREGAQIIGVDHLGHIKAPGREPRDRVDAVVQELTELAKVENVWVIALSHFSRPDGKNINARPNMHWFKESGTIEGLAHVALLLYVPLDDDGRPKCEEEEIIIGKQREGAVGAEPMSFDWRHQLWKPRSRQVTTQEPMRYGAGRYGEGSNES